MIYFCSGVYPIGLGLAYSADGLHWQIYEGNPVDTNGVEPIGDVVYALKEPDSSKVVVYYRVRLRVRPRRTLARAESSDLIHWSGHQVIMAADDLDPPDAELHGLTPFRYGDYVLGLLWVGTENNSRIEVQLACSRDGFQWTRLGDRKPFIALGPTGSFDARIIARTTMPILVGQELWFYYMGLPALPGQLPTVQGGIGLATITLDRFVAMEADDEEGVIVTKAINVFDQEKLLVNGVVNPDGYIIVELLDDEHNPIPGFSREEAIPFYESAVFHQITWREHHDVSQLTGKAVRVRFFLRRAKLFAFRLCHSKVATSDLLAGIC
jgi:hypothetical protein